MCISMTALALMGAATAAGAVTTGVSSAMNAAVANEQLSQDILIERTRAANDMADRLDLYAKMEASNRVAAAVAMGGGTNLSYNTGIAPENWEKANIDIERIGYNEMNAVARKKYGIAVNNASIGMDVLNSVGTSVAGFAGRVGGSYLGASSPLTVTKAT